MTLADRLAPILEKPNRPLASIAVAIFKEGRITEEAYLGHRYIDSTDPAKNLPITRETYSSFSRWEEEIMTTLHRTPPHQPANYQ
ncbi:MAG: hypothetical protein AAF702_05330 [Chloroflexota bacterium]